MNQRPTIVDNLVWTHGTCWAIWRVPTGPYAYQASRHQHATHAKVQSVLTALTTPTIWLSVCRELDAADVLEQMVTADDPLPWRQLAAETPRQLSALADLSGVSALFERRTYIAAQLPGPATGIKAFAAAVLSGSAAAAGLDGQRVDDKQLQLRRRQAAELASSMGALPLTDVPAWEVAWLYRRQWLRGITPPALEPPTVDTPVPQRIRPGVIDAVLMEGGTTEDVDRPDHRRYVRVDTPWGTGYQTAVVIADTPQQWTFPGGNGEWLAAVDQAPWPVEWAMRIEPTANDVARRQAKQHARQLTGQWDQHDGNPDRDTAHGDLARAVDAVADHLEDLTSTPSAPELMTTTIYCLAAPRLADLEDRARRLVGLFSGCEYVMARPTGDQVSLMDAMLPGKPVAMRGPTAWVGSAHAASHYRQWLLPRALASAMPTVSGSAGDDGGMLLGINRDSPGSHVLFDPSAGPRSGRSGSLAVFGVLGSGKSYLLKRCAHAVVARGGAVIVLDRTVQGEYARLAPVMPGRSRVVTLSGDTDATLDPMVLFDTAAERERYSIGFLTQLTGVSMTTSVGVALGQAVKSVAAAGGRLADVVDHLDAAGDPKLTDLVASLQYLAAEPLARVAFGDAQPLRLDEDYIVVSTAGLSLPDREQLDHREELLPEQVVSQALLYLVAASAKRATFARDDQFAVTMLDEAWSLSASPAGRSLLLELLRDGRKHNAAAWLGSQLPADLSADGRLLDLVSTIGVFRLAGEAVASGMEVLGLDEDDTDLRDMLTSADDGAMPTGTCLWRDPAGRVARVAVAHASLDELEEAFDTTPDRATIVTAAA